MSHLNNKQQSQQQQSLDSQNVGQSEDVKRVLTLLESGDSADRGFACSALTSSPALTQWAVLNPAVILTRLVDPELRVRQEAAGALRNVLSSTTANTGDPYAACDEYVAANVFDPLFAAIKQSVALMADPAAAATAAGTGSVSGATTTGPSGAAVDSDVASVAAPRCLYQQLLLVAALCESSDDAVTRVCGEQSMVQLLVDVMKDIDLHRRRTSVELALAASQCLLIITEANEQFVSQVLIGKVWPQLLTEGPQLLSIIVGTTTATTTTTTTSSGGSGSSTISAAVNSTGYPDELAVAHRVCLAASFGGALVQCALCMDQVSLVRHLLTVMLDCLTTANPFSLLLAISPKLEPILKSVPHTNETTTAGGSGSTTTADEAAAALVDASARIPVDVAVAMSAFKYLLSGQKVCLEILTNLFGVSNDDDDDDGDGFMKDDDDNNNKNGGGGGGSLNVAQLLIEDPEWMQFVRACCDRVLVKCMVPKPVLQCLLSSSLLDGSLSGNAVSTLDLQAHLVFSIQTRAVQCADNMVTSLAHVHPDVARRIPFMVRLLCTICQLHGEPTCSGMQQQQQQQQQVIIPFASHRAELFSAALTTVASILPSTPHADSGPEHQQLLALSEQFLSSLVNAASAASSGHATVVLVQTWAETSSAAVRVVQWGLRPDQLSTRDALLVVARLHTDAATAATLDSSSLSSSSADLLELVVVISQVLDVCFETFADVPDDAQFTASLASMLPLLQQLKTSASQSSKQQNQDDPMSASLLVSQLHAMTTNLSAFLQYRQNQKS